MSIMPHTNIALSISEQRRSRHPNKDEIESNKSLIQRLYLAKKGSAHTGCVNTVQWDERGEFLVSGSDDRNVCVWSNATKKCKVKVPTGHGHNIFCAKFLPNDHDQIISCAGDGQLRRTYTTRNTNEMLAETTNMMLKFAFVPTFQSVCLATSMSGSLTLCDLRESPAKASVITEYPTVLFIQSPFLSSAGLSGITFDPFRPNSFAVGVDNGSVSFLDIRCPPVSMLSCNWTTRVPQLFEMGRTGQRVTAVGPLEESPSGLEFSTTHPHELIVNYRNGPLRLFDLTHSAKLDSCLRKTYTGRRNVETFCKDVNFMHGGHYIGSGGDTGQVYIWNKRSGELVFSALADTTVVNCVCPHPTLPDMVTAGIDRDIKWWQCGDVAQVLSGANKRDIEDGGSPSGSLRQRMRHRDTLLSAEEAEAGIRVANELRMLGNENFRLERYQEAAVQYERALERIQGRCSHPPLEEERIKARLPCLVNLAACHIKNEKYEDAVAVCSEALTIDPNHFKARFRRAQAYTETGKFQEALADIANAKSNGGDAAALAALERTVREGMRAERQREAAMYQRMFQG